MIVGPGPSFSSVPIETYSGFTVFALNHTITKLFNTCSDVFWVSNDHDRTFAIPHVAKSMNKTLSGWKKWRTITNRKFAPGRIGDITWQDRHGQWQKPLKWRLPCPDGSEIFWYEETKEREGWLRNGESVIELALEVATLWGFSRVVLIGVDLCLYEGAKIRVRQDRDDQDLSYYADGLDWKPIPKNIRRGKMKKVRASVERHLDRWSKMDIRSASKATSFLFEEIKARDIAGFLCGRVT